MSSSERLSLQQQPIHQSTQYISPPRGFNIGTQNIAGASAVVSRWKRNISRRTRISRRQSLPRRKWIARRKRSISTWKSLSTWQGLIQILSGHTRIIKTSLRLSKGFNTLNRTKSDLPSFISRISTASSGHIRTFKRISDTKNRVPFPRISRFA